jgi:hypothetical protein
VSQRTNRGLLAAVRACYWGGGVRTPSSGKRTRRSADVSEQHSQEQRTESAIKVRQVTDVHSNWSKQGDLEHGKFSYQLILDNGAQEELIMPTADDAKVLRDLFHDADTIYWDLEREVLIFGKIA